MRSNIRVLAFVALLGSAAFATPTVLTDLNATAIFSDSGNGASDLVSWSANNSTPNQVFNEGYWFRLGTSGTAAQLGTIGAPTITTSGTNRVDYLFANNSFSVLVRYLLTGDTNTSDMTEVVRVHNFTNETLHFELFEYDDFDLNGSADGDTVSLLNSSTINQAEGGTSVTVGGTPLPTHFQLAPFGELLNMFNTGFGNLDDDPTSFTGDSTFAMQWVFDIAPNGDSFVSKDKNLVVPEPASMAVLGLGAIALIKRRRRK